MKSKSSNTVIFILNVAVGFLVMAVIFFTGVFAGIQNTYEYRFKKDTLYKYNVVTKDTTITLTHIVLEIDTMIKRDTVYIHAIKEVIK